jgi:hypothetical protein
MIAPWTVNDDVESEFRYWLSEFLAALKTGALFGLATGLVIALLPRMPADSGIGFIRDFWVYLVEFAFWLGMLLSMLWSAGKRIGAALAGSLPWQAPQSERAATARFFGQSASFAAMIALSLWLAVLVARASPDDAVAAVVSGIAQPLLTASWLAAAIFAVVALVCRLALQARRKAPRPR